MADGTSYSPDQVDQVIDPEFTVEKSLSPEKYAAAFEPLEELAKAYIVHPPKVLEDGHTVDKSEYLTEARKILGKVDTDGTFSKDQLVAHLRLKYRKFAKDTTQDPYPEMAHKLDTGDMEPAFREFVAGAANDYDFFRKAAFGMAVGAPDERGEKIFKRETAVEMHAVNAAENLYRAAVVVKMGNAVAK